ncbi:MAG: bifunctional 4-hydroxy-2-oxoglutarate aldolase/2-dehydro-3-deoxy-phosphogluconate aldolase [Verrucomicrobia bacterium]|nr:bifunctional 4-hydroxy-2-oxoglutarate aldolase/2-dehydro-3-deoxy-phosphogluconate aldolase [Verrucomicrobiota bacterium]
MKGTFSWELFNRLPVVGILRGFDRYQLVKITEAARRGGLTNLEITMNTPGAAEQIQQATAQAGSAMNIGAGTVLSLDDLEQALAAGASFIVTPVVNDVVIRRCKELDVPVFPGAFTPTEIVRAWELGAALVKVFPAEVLGPAFIKAVKAPLPHVKLMPTGGVDLKTLPEYLRVGADAFGVGSPLFKQDRIVAGDWPRVEAQCRAFVEAYAAATSAARS